MGLINRFFRREDESPAAPAPSREEIFVDGCVVGLSFDYVRPASADRRFLADAGVDRILGILQARGLRATFHCPARLCETAPERVARIVEAGHEISVLGYDDESPRELTRDAVRQLVYACRNAFARRGLHPIGFRAPHSHWDERLVEELAAQDFCYDAEHDHAKRPYVLTRSPQPVVRVPICTDARGLRLGEKHVNLTLSKIHRYLRKAIVRGHFVAVGFHPWILEEELERVAYLEEWLDVAARSGARMIALEDVLPPAYRQGGAA